MIDVRCHCFVCLFARIVAAGEQSSSGDGGERREVGERRRRPSSAAAGDMERLFQILEEPQHPTTPRVPEGDEQMYYFALSIVPCLNSLSQRGRLQARIRIMTLLDEFVAYEASLSGTNNLLGSEWQPPSQQY